jgi:hypothetical protein
MNIELKVKFEGNSEEGKDLHLFAVPIQDDDTGTYEWVHIKSEGMDVTIFEITIEELKKLVDGVNIAVKALLLSEASNSGNETK